MPAIGVGTPISLQTDPSTEAELVALADCAIELLYLMGVLTFIGFDVSSAVQVYTDNKVGVDVVDQKDAARITDHGSKKTPWHRVHDSIVNTAANLAFEHEGMLNQLK